MSHGYRTEIDGLRALAVVPVVLFHAGVRGFEGGFAGVDVFFVISGYLITSILLAEQADGRYSIAAFYERRARRILPALFLVLIVCLPLAWLWMLPNLLQEFGQSLAAVAAFASNLFFMRLPGYFDSPAGLKPLLHTWSLAVEEQFYLFFPVLLWLIARHTRRWLVHLLCVLSVISLALALLRPDTTQEGTFYSTPARMWELLCGAIVAAYHHPQGFRRHAPALEQSGAILGVLFIVLSILCFDRNTPWPGLPTLLPVSGASLVILFANPDTLAGRLLSLRVLTGIGLLSYSLYLWHQPLLAFARVRSIEEPGTALLLALCVVALALAALSWRYVERPWRDRQRWSRRAVFAGAVAGSAVFISIGFVTSRLHGFEERAAVSRLDLFLPDDIRECVYPTHGRDHVLCTDALQPVEPGSTRRIVFIGDSLLAAARDGIEEGARRAGVEVNFAPVWGCPALMGVTRQLEGHGSKPCRTFTQSVYGLVHDEHVTDVVLYSAFNRYLRAPLAGHTDMRAGRDDRERGCASVDECIAQTGAALAQTVRTLQSWQVRVWVVRQLPDYALIFAKDDLNERLFFRGPQAVRMQRDAYEVDGQPFSAALAGTDAGIIDFSPRFCDRTQCSPLAEGRMAYYDNDHLGQRGSLMLADAWARQLRGMTAMSALNPAAAMASTTDASTAE